MDTDRRQELIKMAHAQQLKGALAPKPIVKHVCVYCHAVGQAPCSECGSDEFELVEFKDVRRVHQDDPRQQGPI